MRGVTTESPLKTEVSMQLIDIKQNIPMTVFFSFPNAQTQWGSPGT